MMTRPLFKALWAALILALLFPVAALADFEQAMSHFKAGKYVEAAAEFQALVDQSPDYADGYQMLGHSFIRMGKYDEAAESFQKAIELNGDKFEFHHGLAQAYLSTRQFSKAVATLRTAEPLATDDRTKYHLFYLRGMAYAGLEKWADTIEDLERANAIQPSDAILDRLGLAYYSLGHTGKAVPILRKSLQKSPDNAGNLMMLTTGLLDMGAEASSDSQKEKYYEEAQASAERFRKLKPGYEADNLVGRAAFGAKDYATAERAFQRVIESKPDYCYAMVNLGKLYIAQEQWANAEKTLTQAATCAPRMAVVHESLGFSVQKQGKLQEAIDHYKKAIAIKPSASVQKLIDTCQKNLEIRAENQAMAEEEARIAEEERKAKEEYEEQMRKKEEWEKRREKDD